jgi:SAM-dependent methyltransferase
VTPASAPPFTPSQAWRFLCRTTARRYRFNWMGERSFVAGKLRFDPLYQGLLSGVAWPSPLRLLDLGCGRGILLALLDEARLLQESGRWPAEWPRLPGIESPRGVDRPGLSLEIARRAVPGWARWESADLVSYTPSGANAIVLADVLHYLDASAQEKLLHRACASLPPGGILLLREVDAAGGSPAWATRAGERLRAMGRGEPLARFVYRPIREWAERIRGEGLSVTIRPLDEGTPFANSLIQASRAA